MAPSIIQSSLSSLADALPATKSLPSSTTTTAEAQQQTEQTHTNTEATAPPPPNKLNYIPGHTVVNTPAKDVYTHRGLLPTFPTTTVPALTDVPYTDKGLLGSPTFHNLLSHPDIDEIFDYQPKIGTEITGLQLSTLNDLQKNDLARLIATRGVVFFRNQDITLEQQLDLGRYFGSLHTHATTAQPANGQTEIHVVYTDGASPPQPALFNPSKLWHSDVTYEAQPPSYTSLKLVTAPPRGGGGDTLWVSGYALYDYLSPHMQTYLSSLTAIHSAEEQAQGARNAGRTVRREPVTTAHPLVRTHPVTGWRSVFFNPGFVRGIAGVPKIESEAIIKLLTELLSTAYDLQARFVWREGDVAFWDNRATAHSATYGFYPHRRHAVRVTVTAEKPYFDKERANPSQEEEYFKSQGWPLVKKDGTGLFNYND